MNKIFKFTLYLGLYIFLLDHTQMAHAQRDLELIHGFDGSDKSWAAYSNWIVSQDPAGKSNHFNYPKTFETHNGVVAFKNDILTKYPDNPYRTNQLWSPNNILMAHSMGGMALRELDHSDISTHTGEHGIITVGSPLDGTFIANNVNNGQVRAFGEDGVSKSLLPLVYDPFVAKFHIPINFVLHSILDILSADEMANGIIGDWLLGKFFKNDRQASINDFAVGSNYLQSAQNYSATNTHKISICGNVANPGFWRFVSSALYSPNAPSAVPVINPNDDDNGMVDFASVVADVYYVGFIADRTIAFANTFAGFFDPWQFGVAAYYFWVADLWHDGYLWWNDEANRTYTALSGATTIEAHCVTSYNITCTPQYYYGYCYSLGYNTYYNQFKCQADCLKPYTYCTYSDVNGLSDGFIKATSQYGYQSPGWNPEQKIKVDYINHNEEANNIKMQATYQRIFFITPGYFNLQ